LRRHREVTVELKVKVVAEGEAIAGHMTPEQEAAVAKQAAEATEGEGQGGAVFFIIGEGTAKVTVHGEARATLGPGDYFGEIALIDEGARTATVTADTDMKTYAMTFWEFRPIVESR
jgi:CRP-like cAMP-binding protein